MQCPPPFLIDEHCTEATDEITNPSCCCKKCTDGFVPACPLGTDGNLSPLCDERSTCGCKCRSNSERRLLLVAGKTLSSLFLHCWYWSRLTGLCMRCYRRCCRRFSSPGKLDRHTRLIHSQHSSPYGPLCQKCRLQESLCCAACVVCVNCLQPCLPGGVSAAEVCGNKCCPNATDKCDANGNCCAYGECGVQMLRICR